MAKLAAVVNIEMTLSEKCSLTGFGVKYVNATVMRG